MSGYSKLSLERKSKGLCICGTKPSLGKVLCPLCATEHSQKSMELRIYRKKNNLCYACGSNLKNTLTYCNKCKKKNSESCRKLIKDRHSKGLCRCGCKATIGKVCEICWFKRTATWNTGTQKNWEAIKDKLGKQNYRCVYTQETLIPGKNASLDHIIPKCKGGTSSLDNLQWITIFVNTRMKYLFTHDEFIHFIKNIIKNDQGIASA